MGADDLGVGCTVTRAISRRVLGRQARAPPLNVENQQNVRLRGKGNVLQPRGGIGHLCGDCAACLRARACSGWDLTSFVSG